MAPHCFYLCLFDSVALVFRIVWLWHNVVDRLIRVHTTHDISSISRLLQQFFLYILTDEHCNVPSRKLLDCLVVLNAQFIWIWIHACKNRILVLVIHALYQPEDILVMQQPIQFVIRHQQVQYQQFERRNDDIRVHCVFLD